jgi:signal transduction histidine kinase
MFSALNNKLFKNSIFRLSLVYMAIFSVSVVLLFGFIYWATAGYMLRQTEATIEAEIVGLVEHYDQSGFGGLLDVVKERLSRSSGQENLYLLSDLKFKPLLGNLDQWPEGEIAPSSWLEFDFASDGMPHKGLARVFLLQNKYYLLVGQDIHQLQKIQSLIRDAMFWGVLMTLVLALVGGLMMSKTMMRRIEAINDTCHRIMDGDLSQRIDCLGGNDDFDKLVHTLNRMLEQIEQLMHGVKQVSDNIAHDLRTPLSHLLRNLEMLRIDGSTKESHKDLLDQAIAEADGLLATFKALLRISEIESGSRRANFQKIDLSALLDDLVELYEPLAQEKDQLIEWYSHEISSVHGDRDLLFQAFSNILDNAIKYSPEQGRIQVLLDEQEDCTDISIVDTGPGIPEEEIAKVLERFYRLESDRSSPGNGLGLSLVDAIAKLHHGKLHLADDQSGLRVTISLPKSL